MQEHCECLVPDNEGEYQRCLLPFGHLSPCEYASIDCLEYKLILDSYKELIDEVIELINQWTNFEITNNELKIILDQIKIKLGDL